jgi:acyl-CoA thioesterase FadM
MDALGRVNQAAYHELLEEARTALLSRLPGRRASQIAAVE